MCICGGLEDTCVSKSSFNSFPDEAIYSQSVKVLVEGMYEFFSMWEGSPFYGPERAELLRGRRQPLCPVAPSWNIMFVYLWREFILLIHWLALLQRLKEFDFHFIYPLHFSFCGRVVSCVIPRENFLFPRCRPLWNEITARKRSQRQRTQDIIELLFIAILFLCWCVLLSITK